MVPIQEKAMRADAFNALLTLEHPRIKTFETEFFKRNEIILVFEVDEFNFKTGSAAIVRIDEFTRTNKMPGVYDSFIDVSLLEIHNERE